MNMKNIIRYLPIFALFGVTSCGEGYEMVMVRNQVPYGEERTAGPGVAYVRAHLMPEKMIVIPAPMVTPQIQDAAPLFDLKVQKK